MLCKKMFLNCFALNIKIILLFIITGADIAERHALAFADEDLETSRRRAEKHIRQEHVFDSRAGRIGRGAALLDTIENGFNDEVRRFFS